MPFLATDYAKGAQSVLQTQMMQQDAANYGRQLQQQMQLRDQQIQQQAIQQQVTQAKLNSLLRDAEDDEQAKAAWKDLAADPANKDKSIADLNTLMAKKVQNPELSLKYSKAAEDAKYKDAEAKDKAAKAELEQVKLLNNALELATPDNIDQLRMQLRTDGSINPRMLQQLDGLIQKYGPEKGLEMARQATKSYQDRKEERLSEQGAEKVKQGWENLAIRAKAVDATRERTRAYITHLTTGGGSKDNQNVSKLLVDTRKQMSEVDREIAARERDLRDIYTLQRPLKGEEKESTLRDIQDQIQTLKEKRNGLQQDANELRASLANHATNLDRQVQKTVQAQPQLSQAQSTWIDQQAKANNMTREQVIAELKKAGKL